MSPSKKYIETEYFWSINLKKSIDLIAVDEKSTKLHYS